MINVELGRAYKASRIACITCSSLYEMENSRVIGGILVNILSFLYLNKLLWFTNMPGWEVT